MGFKVTQKKKPRIRALGEKKNLKQRGEGVSYPGKRLEGLIKTGGPGVNRGFCARNVNADIVQGTQREGKDARET